jgi:DNA-binding NtrC family response regulator
VEVIMLTGHATVETAIDGMKLGALDYLMKPCEMDLLMAKVEEAAAKKRAQENKIVAARLKEITSRRP